MRDANRSTFNGDTYVTGSQAMKFHIANGTTSATGALTVTIPAGVFTTVLAVVANPLRNTTDPTTACFAVVRSFSATQVVIQVFESKSTGVLLGGNVEGLEATSTATVVSVLVVGT